jgi:two-component system, OmpR family, KDP operon response regulator KdpE
MVRTGPLTVDLVSRVVTLDGRYIALTRQEYRLVHLLASHLGSVIIHNEVMEEIWGNPCPNNVQYVRTLMRQLRRKLEVDPSQPKLLISESGVGYRLERHKPVNR